MKTILVLLLVIVVSVPLSYAQQSNSEIIRDIDNNTNVIIDAIRSIQTSLDGLVNSTNNQLDSLTDTLRSVQGSVASVDSRISDFDDTLATILVNTGGIPQMISTMTVMSNNIGEIESRLDSRLDGSLGGIDDTIGDLADDIARYTADTNSRLNAIESTLDDIKATLEDLPTTADGPDLSSDLVRSTTVLEVNSYTYKSHGTKSGSVYELDVSFSCNGPIRLDSVSTNVRNPHPPVIPVIQPVSSTPENYLKVNDQLLYNSKFELTPGNYQVYNRAVDFGLRALGAGQTLNFESVQYEDGTIADSTTNNHTFRYDIEVEYQGNPSTKCMFDIGSTRTLSIDATLKTAPGDLTTRFADRIGCDDQTVQITDIQAAVLGNWDRSLASASSFEITILDGVDDSVPDYTTKFRADASLQPLQYPIQFSDDLQIDAHAPNATELPIVITYSAPQGVSCSVVP